MSVAPMHTTVLLTEAVEALQLRPHGIYVDGTFGRGGHTGAILQQLDGGRVIAFDKDPEAIAYGKERFASEPRLTLVADGFETLAAVCASMGVHGDVAGVLLDLGVSSPQLDTATRGFSFQQDGDLDMRMNPQSGISASEWLNQASAEEIARVLWLFGEERFSRQIARAIVEARQQMPIERTRQLAELVASCVRTRDKHRHPATRSFQAIRIFINDELGVLESVLQQAVDCLAIGGRLVCISFHSLEDRIVKQFFQSKSKPPATNRHLPPVSHATALPLSIVGKPVRPSADEVSANPRARSAVMRVAEKVAA